MSGDLGHQGPVFPGKAGPTRLFSLRKSKKDPNWSHSRHHRQILGLGAGRAPPWGRWGALGLKGRLRVRFVDTMVGPRVEFDATDPV